MSSNMNENVYKKRIDKLVNKMQAESLDLMIVYSDVWRPGNVGYLTGWRQGGGGVSQAWTMLLISPRKEPVLVVGFELLRQAKVTAEGVKRIEPSDKIEEIIKEYNSEIKPANVGLIGENIMPYSIYKQIRTGLNGLEASDKTYLLTQQRRIKTEHEIECIKKSFEITDTALLETIKEVRAGITEIELSSIGTSIIHRKGGYLAFYPTVAAGLNSAIPMQTPTSRRVEHGDLIMIDFGTVLDGFFSDTTRTIAFGVKDKTKKAIIDTALIAAEEGLKLVKPGIEICEIEKVVRKVIRENGYIDYIIHNVGHGIGQDQEEDFPIGPDSRIVLEPGMTFTIEPGIYIPGVGGCRIEEMIVVTETGAETFCKLKRDWVID